MTIDTFRNDKQIPRRRWLPNLAALLVSVLALTACGQKGDLYRTDRYTHTQQAAN